MTERTDAYTNQLFEAVRARLTEYIRLANVHLSGKERARLRLTITIVTVRDAPGLIPIVRRYATDALAGELNGAKLDTVRVDIDAGLGEPGHTITIEPSPETGPPTDPGDATVRSPGDSSTVRLTLLYELDLRLEYRLRSMNAWVPMGRRLPERGLVVPIEVPRYVAAVPRGRLLLLRYWDGLAEIRRTDERPHYRVAVDGRPLLPGKDLVCAGDGEIAYHDQSGGTGPSIIRYRITRES